MTSKNHEYQKIDLSQIDRKKIKQNHGIETNEKIKIYDEIKHVKELWTFPNGIKETSVDIRCHWDHHSFNGVGIFCPLNYKPKQVAKIGQNDIKQRITGTSENFNNYMIKENIPRCKDISTFNKNIMELTDAYYEVDGVFCSPECCLAYINEKSTSKVLGSQYSESERLLYFMLGLTPEAKIFPANNFRLLKEYGGNLTIEQFRKNNKSIKYEYHGTTVLISHLFEKKINLSTN
jgi:hypothetical protein